MYTTTLTVPAVLPKYVHHHPVAQANVSNNIAYAFPWQDGGRVSKWQDGGRVSKICTPPPSRPSDCLEHLAALTVNGKIHHTFEIP
jgi:hypothetical protein